MDPLNRSQQLIIATILLLLMIVTRYHHFGSVLLLPDASWAIFIAGGFYLSRINLFGIFLAAAGAIDFFAITQGGTSSYCISPAYLFLIPAYAALWWGGRWYQKYYRFKWSNLFPLASTTIASVTVCFLISNSAFYTLSGKFGDLNMVEYTGRILKYFPDFLNTTAGYIAIFAAVHIIVKALDNIYGADSTRHA